MVISLTVLKNNIIAPPKRRVDRSLTKSLVKIHLVAWSSSRLILNTTPAICKSELPYASLFTNYLAYYHFTFTHSWVLTDFIHLTTLLSIIAFGSHSCLVWHEYTSYWNGCPWKPNFLSLVSIAKYQLTWFVLFNTQKLSCMHSYRKLEDVRTERVSFICQNGWFSCLLLNLQLSTLLKHQCACQVIL